MENKEEIEKLKTDFENGFQKLYTDIKNEEPEIQVLEVCDSFDYVSISGTLKDR